MAHNKAREPAVRFVVDELIAKFGVDPSRTDFLGEFDRQEESITCRRNAAAHRIIRIVEKKLGKNRNGKTLLSGIVETPLNPRIGLTQTECSGGEGMLHPQPGIFVGELDAIAYAEMDIQIGDVRDGLIAVEEGHVADIDFPISRAGGAEIIGVVGRATLGERGGRGSEQTEQKD